MNAPALPAETAVGRVSLRVADLDRLVEFYTTVVGLAVQHHDSDRAVLGAGGRSLLELHHRPDLPARGRDEAGLFHTAFRVPGRDSLGGALERIESEWRLTGASDHRVSEALYLRDPENNGVELYRDRPRPEWPVTDGRVQMDTLPLDLDTLRAEATSDDALPAATDVGHVHLEVTDIAAARQFYVETLGLSVRQEWGEDALFVAAGDYHHHVGLNTWNGRSDPATGRGLDWVELLVPDETTLEALRERFEHADTAVRALDDGITVEGPDGISLRIHLS